MVIFTMILIECAQFAEYNVEKAHREVAMDKKIVFAEKAPAPIGPYNHGIIINNVLFTSAQLGLNPATGELVNSSFEAEVRQAMDNMKAILEAGGTSFDNMIKCSLTLTDLNNFAVLNKIYSEYVKEDTAPARSCVASALLKGARFQIEVVAAL